MASIAFDYEDDETPMREDFEILDDDDDLFAIDGSTPEGHCVACGATGARVWATHNVCIACARKGIA